MGDMNLNRGTLPASAAKLVALLESGPAYVAGWTHEGQWLDHTTPLREVVPEGEIALQFHVWGPNGYEAQLAWCSWLNSVRARVKTPVFEVVPDPTAYDGKTRLRFNGESAPSSLSAITAAIQASIR
jgi:hypothetical protein